MLDARIEEDGHRIWAVLTRPAPGGGTITVRERIGRQVLGWSNEKQMWYLDVVNQRLQKKMLRKMAREWQITTPPLKTPRRDVAGEIRRAFEHLRKRRVAKMKARAEKRRSKVTGSDTLKNSA